MNFRTVCSLHCSPSLTRALPSWTRVETRVDARRARRGRFGRARGLRARPVGISVSACVGERAGLETHRKPGEVVICRVQKKVHRDTAPPMAAQMG